MLKDLALLIRLQDIDDELMEIEAEMGDQPEQLNRLQGEIDGFKKELSETENSLEEIKIQKKEQKKFIDAAREQLKKSQGVIYNVKTTKEYDAISTEIERAKMVITNSEKRQLELMMQEEELQTLHNDLMKKLSSVDNEFIEQESEMQDQLNNSHDEVTSLREERNEIVKALKNPVYAHYQRIRKLRDGIGISHLTDNACGYCFSKIPPQRQSEVKRMDDIILCEVCGCILVSEKDP